MNIRMLNWNSNSVHWLCFPFWLLRYHCISHKRKTKFVNIIIFSGISQIQKGHAIKAKIKADIFDCLYQPPTVWEQNKKDFSIELPWYFSFFLLNKYWAKMKPFSVCYICEKIKTFLARYLWLKSIHLSFVYRISMMICSVKGSSGYLLSSTVQLKSFYKSETLFHSWLLNHSSSLLGSNCLWIHIGQVTFIHWVDFSCLRFIHSSQTYSFLTSLDYL